jgi:hypothetical protein
MTGAMAALLGLLWGVALPILGILLYEKYVK